MFICGFLYFQYEGQSDNYSDALDYMNMIFTGVFTVEFVLKLMAFRVKVGSPGHWPTVYTRLILKSTP